ncbi:MAG: aminotransferase class IV [Micromonosporaceae bacterium]|nr:aminotransferase class IV [Micromonosporaceae bacterium]
MSDPTRVLAVLGRGVVPADTPFVRGDDLGIVRGDGIFEVMHVRAGRPWLLEEHLNRLAGSAARMELAVPPRAALVELVDQAVTAWPAHVEGALRLVCTRGPEAGGDPTVYATVFAIAPESIRARRDGLHVLTATLGLPARLRPDTPWLLGGAKTLSYATNMASLRWAKASGADDVLWVSSDGYALEGPISSLVWRQGSTLYTVPAKQTGILAGTTAAYLLAHAGEIGLAADEALVTPAELQSADGAWLTSSVRGPAPIRTLDGTPLPYDPDVTARIRTLLGFPLPPEPAATS